MQKNNYKLQGIDAKKPRDYRDRATQQIELEIYVDSRTILLDNFL